MTVVGLMIHALVGILLLGAVTHQTIAITAGTLSPPPGFLQHLTRVRPEVYTNAIAACYLINFLLGAVLYTRYRIEVRPFLEDSGLLLIAGLFESKEHVGALGLGLLPAYWLFWKAPASRQSPDVRKWLTVLLAAFVWWNFLVGHIVNNVRGLAT